MLGGCATWCVPMNRVRDLLLILLLFSPVSAFACQCARRPSVEDAVKDNELVITGIVLGHHPAAVSRDQFRESAQRYAPRWFPVTKIEIGVTRVYRGDPPEKITLTHIGCCVCEETLEDGKEYLLFVRPSWELQRRQMVSFCDPNKEIATSPAILHRLGPARRSVSRLHFGRTTGERFAYGVDWILNSAARIYWKPLSRREEEPLLAIPDSPWFLLAKVLAAGAVLGLLVVAVRRRVKRHPVA